MDPRKAAKVTAPDLLKAFQEGTGRAPEEGSGEERVFVMLVAADDTPIGSAVWPLSEMGFALAAVSKHLMRGAGYAAALIVATEPPEGFFDMTAISAAD